MSFNKDKIAVAASIIYFGAVALFVIGMSISELITGKDYGTSGVGGRPEVYNSQFLDNRGVDNF